MSTTDVIWDRFNLRDCGRCLLESSIFPGLSTEGFVLENRFSVDLNLIWRLESEWPRLCSHEPLSTEHDRRALVVDSFPFTRRNLTGRLMAAGLARGLHFTAHPLARPIPKCTAKTLCFPSREVRICWKRPQTVQLWNRPVNTNAALESWLGKRPQGSEGILPLS